MQKAKTLTACRRSNHRTTGAARARLRTTAGRPLAMLSMAPAPALTILAAGLSLALVGGGYIVAGLATMPALGLALAIRGAAHGGGWSSPAPRRRLTRLDRAVNVIGVLSAAGLVILGLVAMLWR